MSSALRLAVGTLTVLPTGPVPAIDLRTAGRAMIIAPFAVLPVALAAATAGRLAALADWPGLVCGLSVVAVLAVGTRALHLDGLADTVDGFGSGWDRERALAVMRRGDIGPMGVTALVLVLGLQASAASVLTEGWADALLLTMIICTSRAALVLACRTGVPAARSEGLGAAVAGSVAPAAAVTVWVITLGVLTAAGLWSGGRWWASSLAAVLAAAAVMILVSRAVRSFGGVTGDVMGAGVEVALTIMLLGGAAQ